MDTYLYHRNSGRMYKIVGRDKTAGTITLSCDLATFTDTFNMETAKRQGYFPVQAETEAKARKMAEKKIRDEGAQDQDDEEEAA